jgi:transcriptional regulator with XRE-family HTH domain
METNVAAFKDRIKAVRQGLGLSQEAFAERLGYRRLRVSQWESGKGIPLDTDLEKIAAVLRVTTAYLRGLTDDPNEKLSSAALSPFETLVIAAQRIREADDAIQAALRAYSARDSGKEK